MKIEPRRVEAFLRDPGTTRIILLYGGDRTLVSERALALVKLIAGSADDPFRVVFLQRDDATALHNEMSSLSLTGGRRVVHVRDAGDAFADPVRVALAGRSSGVAVLEAGELLPRSKLRGLVEQATEAIAIPCYNEDASVFRRLLADEFACRRVKADDETVVWLANRVPDRSTLRQEAEKLALYVGVGGMVGMSDALGCVADLGSQSVDDALFAATSGDVPGTDRGLTLAISEGAGPVQILRAAIGHFQRLYQASIIVEGGVSAIDAARRIRPPVFAKRLPLFTASVERWTRPELARACRMCQDSERACKRTGAPADEIARGRILALAHRGAQLGRR